VPERSDAAIDPDAFNAFEVSGWQQRASGYDRAFGSMTSRLAEPLLDAASVATGTRVLDVATGPGYVAGRAAARGASVVGVDIAGAMVELASRSHPGVDFREADAHALPFEDASFDGVVGNLAILHLGRPEQAAGEFARVLDGGGRLALTTWDSPERTPFFGVIVGAVADAGARPPEDIPAGPDFFRFSADEAFDTLLAEQGLEERTVTRVPFTVRFSSPDELWDGLLAGTVRMAALIERQPAETRRRIREAFDRRVADYRRGEAVELPVAVKLASGRKPG
jgi:SAM-dependent methyltransferase